MKQDFTKKVISFILVGVMVTGSAVGYLNHQNRSYEKQKKQMSVLCKIQQEKLQKIEVIPEKNVPKQLDLYAKAALLLDGDNNRVLYQQNGYDKMPMASTTKIMTCIYTLEVGNLNDEVVISRKAASQPKVRLGVKEGEKYLLKDLLYALMLESYNDCAVAIAEHISGSVETFCKNMTSKARDLGAHDTSFQTPNGLDAKEHYTTARDLAVVSAYAIKNPDFLEIINQRSYSMTDVSGNRSFCLHNKDLFLDMYDGAIGIKTGFTNGAGYCFVGAVKQEKKTFVSVVLGSGWPPYKGWKWKDTCKLMDYGMEHFSRRKIIDQSISLGNILVEQGKQEMVPIELKDECELLLGEYENVTWKLKIKKKQTAPIKRGEVLGFVIIKVNGKEYQKLKIVSKKEVKEITYEDVIFRIIKKWTII